MFGSQGRALPPKEFGTLCGMFDTTTLPGWPAVYDPTVLEMLLVTLFIPLGIATVFAVLVFAPAWGRKRQD